MPEYIEREKLIATLREVFEDSFFDHHDFMLCQSIIGGAPTADVVKVVRCKDCKYYKQFKGMGKWCHRRIRSDIEYQTKPTDFCSYGKRKDGAGE